MNNTLNILIKEEQLPEIGKFAYVQRSKDVGVEEPETLTCVVKHVNNLLLSSRTRSDGLLYLAQLVPSIANVTLQEHCAQWLQTTLAALQEPANDTAKRCLCYKILSQLLVKVAQVNSPSLMRTLSLTIIPQLVNQIITQLNTDELRYSINVVAICSGLFPNIISPKRHVFEQKLIQFVLTLSKSSNDRLLFQLLGFGYAKIEFAGNLNAKRWKEEVCKVLDLWQENLNGFNVYILKKMLSRFDLGQHYNKSLTLLEKDDHTTSFYDSLTQRANQLTFIVSALVTIVTGHYNMIVLVPVECILETINNFLLLSNVTAKPSDSTDILAVSHFLPFIYDQLLLVVKALFSCCQTNIISMSRYVNHIITTLINWLRMNQTIEKRSCLALRSAFHQTITAYLNIVGANHCLAKNELPMIVVYLLGNIKSNETSILLTKDTVARSNLLTNDSQLAEVTATAIDALGSLINSSGYLLEPSLSSNIQHEVALALMSTYRNWFNLGGPYQDERCRHKLLECFAGLLFNSAHSCSPMFETALHIFRDAERLENSLLVKSLVRSSMAVLSCMKTKMVVVVSKAEPKPEGLAEKQNGIKKTKVEHHAEISDFELKPIEEPAKSNDVDVSIEPQVPEHDQQKNNDVDVSTKPQVPEGDRQENNHADVSIEPQVPKDDQQSSSSNIYMTQMIKPIAMMNKVLEELMPSTSKQESEKRRLSAEQPMVVEENGDKAGGEPKQDEPVAGTSKNPAGKVVVDDILQYFDEN